ENTGRTLMPHLREGQLVVLESSTYPGTTEEVLQPILEQSGLKAGKDFFLAYSPEREDPGNRDFATRNIPKVVGGLDDASRRVAGSTRGFRRRAGEVKWAMQEYVIERGGEALNDEGKAVRGSRIGVLGVAYKKDVDDPRESPAFPIMQMLRQRGATVTYHDPH